jgi:hypothetical protein
MVKKIGSFLLISIALYTTAAQGAFALRALDLNGQSLEKGAVGVPFALELVITDQQHVQSSPAIKGLEKLHIQEQGLVSTIQTVINGVRSHKKVYRYIVRADKEGTYTLGPATIGGEKSNSISLQVGKHQEIAQGALSLKIDKQHAYVGEPLEFKIRFYPTQSSTLKGLSQPDFSNFFADELEGPTTGIETTQKGTVNYLEWKTLLYPKKTGEIIIPAIYAQYREQRMHNRGGFDMFSSLFDAAFDQKNIYSNSLTLMIEPLPLYHEPVFAVGDFGSLRAKLDHNQARVGEGIVYTLEFEGKGNIQMIPAPQVVVPEGLTVYDSKQGVEKLSNGLHKKSIEYIIQATEPGEWTVPSQTFTYFDPSVKQYKQLRSNQCAFGVTQSPTVVKHDNHSKPIAHSTSNNQIDTKISMLPIDESTWRHTRPLSIPLVWFIVLMSTPLGVILLYRAYSRSRGTISNLIRITRKGYAFRHAYIRINQIEKTATYTMLHSVFVRLLAVRLGIEERLISLEQVREVVAKNVSHDDLISWDNFVNRLLASSFYTTPDSQGKPLAQELRIWLKRLEKFL